MIHPETELRFVSESIGYGVFARQPIPRGTLTWVRDRFDQRFSRDEARQFPAILQQVLYKYAYLDHRGEIVLCWDLARYINHSCEPNCLTLGLDGEFDAEIAIRDIAAGEELTDDYARLHLNSPFPCACGRPGCRGQVGPSDPDRLQSLWRAQLAAALDTQGQVLQPLGELVAEARVLGRP